MAKIALFGAAGAIGKSVAEALHAEGIAYRVVGRSAESLRKSFGDDALAEIRTWNPDDAKSVREAAEGIETIIYLVGVNYWQFELHPVLMRKTIEGAVAAGVKRILLAGTVYAYGKPQSAVVTEDHSREPVAFKGKMRKEQEDILFAADRAGKIQACELRLPDFYGPGVEKSFLWSAFEAAKYGRTAQLVGPIDTLHQFVYVPDVGPIVVQLMKTDAAWGAAWQFAGSGTITQREVVEKIFAAEGRKPKFMVAGKFLLRVVGLFNKLMREMVEMNYLITEPILMSDERLVKLLGEVKRTSYDEGIRATLAAMPAEKK